MYEVTCYVHASGQVGGVEKGREGEGKGLLLLTPVITFLVQGNIIFMYTRITVTTQYCRHCVFAVMYPQQ